MRELSRGLSRDCREDCRETVERLSRGLLLEGGLHCITRLLPDCQTVTVIPIVLLIG